MMKESWMFGQLLSMVRLSAQPDTNTLNLEVTIVKFWNQI